MRRGIAVFGIALLIGLAGCGSGSSTGSPPATQHLGRWREALLHTVIPELEHEGMPSEQIACVKHNMEHLPEREIADWFESGGEGFGPLAQGCF